MPDPGREPYSSPEGAYECLLKSFMEDYSLSSDARSYGMHLATKPERVADGHPWVVRPEVVARELGHPVSRVRRGLAELAKAGYTEVRADARKGSAPRKYTTPCFGRLRVKPQASPQIAHSEKWGAPAGPEAVPQIALCAKSKVSAQIAPQRDDVEMRNIAITDSSSEYCSVLLEEEPRPCDDSPSAPLRARAADLLPGEEISPGTARACEHCRRPGHGVDDCDWLAAPLARLGRAPAALRAV